MHVVVVAGVSMFALMGFVSLLVWRQERHRRLCHQRPPQPEKLLRPAGYTLLLRLDDIMDKAMTKMFVGMGSAALLILAVTGLGPIAYGLLVGKVELNQLTHPRILGSVLMVALFALASLLALIYSAFSIFKHLNQARNCRFGLRGEQAVAEALIGPEVIRAGYTAFHDVPGSEKWNIDHVVVGPAGVFVLETKTRPKRNSTNDLPDHEVRFDGGTLRFPWCYDGKAAAQAKRNAEWMRQFIADFAPKDIVVQAVLVLPGWWVTSQGDYPVKAMNAKYLRGTYLPSLPRRFTPDQLQPILRRLDERCRTLQF